MTLRCWIMGFMMCAGKDAEKALRTFRQRLGVAMTRFRDLCDDGRLPPSLRVWQATMCDNAKEDCTFLCGRHGLEDVPGSVAMTRFRDLCDDGRLPPSLRVWQATMATLQRAHGLTLQEGGEVVHRLAGTMPHPDLSWHLKARVAYAETLTLSMSVEMQFVAVAVDKQAVCTAADAQWQEGRDVLIMVMQHSKNLGATATLVSAQIALARHMQQAAINIFRKLSIASDLHLTAARRSTEVNLQQVLIKQAVNLANATLTVARTLRPSTTATPTANEKAARDVLEAAKRLETRQGQPPNQEETQAIYAALKAADPTLAGGGWYASSHMMRCPNGHAYFIGECGGATQESRCLECGAVIGGTGHRLAAGNTPASTAI
eukprot:CAMPEP_0206151976 /NCGR_PEP_ID=MMETSP1473-20131121/39093_1 /ASSEMBLY_ACC=CAM_ASM_001109 /TAXON_ID=1461547 /ORGANISM="Stichococcus sp, Strain RCC1054" /LENGTH=374 /DNA_ID=CAMNT_0053549529 /DNA_START=106 /DNA_END=1231 /DNA_ORIENTATION=-